MPRTSKKRFYKHTVCVSERDREIYDQVAVVGRPQREVAKEFQISQPRVSKIVNRVFAWMSETAPYGYAEVPRPQRLYGVARTYKRKLEWYENEAKSEWLKSKTDEPWTSAHDLIKSPDGKSIVAEPRKLTRKAAKADVKYLKQAEEFAFKLAHFEGFERNGAVPRHNNDRLFEVPPTVPDEELDDMIAVGKWAAGMKQRQAAETAERGRGGEGESGRMRSDRSVGERDVVPSPPLPLSPSPTPPDRALSPAPPEAGLAQEIAEPNDFHTGVYSPAAASLVAVATIAAAASARREIDSSPVCEPWENGSCDAEARRATESPAEHLSPLPGLAAKYRPHPQGSRPGLLSDALRAEEGDDRHSSEAPRKEYPPVPDGYTRSGDRCRPQVKITSHVPVPNARHLPGFNKQPAKCYELSPDGKAWWPQY